MDWKKISLLVGVALAGFISLVSAVSLLLPSDYALQVQGCNVDMQASNPKGGPAVMVETSAEGQCRVTIEYSTSASAGLSLQALLDRLQ